MEPARPGSTAASATSSSPKAARPAAAAPPVASQAPAQTWPLAALTLDSIASVSQDHPDARQVLSRSARRQLQDLLALTKAQELKLQRTLPLQPPHPKQFTQAPQPASELAAAIPARLDRQPDTSSDLLNANDDDHSSDDNSASGDINIQVSILRAALELDPECLDRATRVLPKMRKRLRMALLRIKGNLEPGAPAEQLSAGEPASVRSPLLTQRTMRHTHQWSQQSPTRHTQHRSFSRCPSTAPAASTYGFAVPGRPAGSSVPHVFAFSPGAQDHSSPSQSSSSYMSMDTSDVSDMDLASPMNLSPWSSSSYPSTAAASVQGSAPRSLSMPAAPQDLSDLIPNMRPSRAYALAVHPLLQTPEERLACTATAEDEPRPSFSQNHPKPLTSVRSSEHSHSAFPLLAMHLDLSQPHPSVASEHQTRQLIPIPIVPSLCDAAVLASSQAAGSQPPHPNMLACQSQQQHQSQESSIIVKIDPQPPSHLIDPRPPSLFESVHSPAHLQLEPPIKRVRQDQDAQLALSLLRSESAPTVSPVLNPSNADPMIAFSLLPSLEELVCLTASGNGQAATAPALVSASSQPASSVNSLPSMLPLLETGNTLSIHTSCSPQPSSILIDARVSSAFAGQALPWDAGSQPCSGGIVTPPYPEIIPTHIIDEMLAPLPRSHPRSARADASQRRPPGAADPAHSFDENVFHCDLE
ncbi:hypothetical protein HK105_200128 [Polyrhizophydium stewartii]|uniref:Uncharacterized protein n=1 Tax=Polyrhizophydium stewartii TaxID=2732419 RepID=A0ABR4NKL6_9FUNG